MVDPSPALTAARAACRQASEALELAEQAILDAAPKELLTTGEVAERFGVSVRAVLHWADTGRLACHRVGKGHRRFALADVEALLSSSKPPAQPAPEPVTHVPTPAQLRWREVPADERARARDCLRNLARRAQTPEQQGALEAAHAVLADLDRRAPGPVKARPCPHATSNGYPCSGTRGHDGAHYRALKGEPYAAPR